MLRKSPHAKRYTGRGAPKTSPEYLVARRGDRLILNMIDADDPAYIPQELVDAALKFIHEKLTAEQKVLVHCNQGRSRSPGIALLYMANQGHIDNQGLASAESAFRKLYPAYSPAAGVRGFMRTNWSRYMGKIF